MAWLEQWHHSSHMYQLSYALLWVFFLQNVSSEATGSVAHAVNHQKSVLLSPAQTPMFQIADTQRACTHGVIMQLQDASQDLMPVTVRVLVSEATWLYEICQRNMQPDRKHQQEGPEGHQPNVSKCSALPGANVALRFK